MFLYMHANDDDCLHSSFGSSTSQLRAGSSLASPVLAQLSPSSPGLGTCDIRPRSPIELAGRTAAAVSGKGSASRSSDLPPHRIAHIEGGCW